MGKSIDIRGPVNANTAYCDGVLVARNVTLTLPEVTHVLATVQTALGEMEVPLYGLIESMEATIQKIGVDMGLARLCQLKNKTLEYRWAQQVTKTNGEVAVEGCKAFLRFIPKSIPAIEVNPGDSIELDVPGSVTRYQLFCNGAEMLLVDKLAGILRINGVDYGGNLDSLL